MTLRIPHYDINLEVSEPKDLIEVRERLGLPVGKPVVSLLGGGLQTKRVRRMAHSLQHWMTEGVLHIVAGRNGELLDALDGVTRDGVRS